MSFTDRRNLLLLLAGLPLSACGFRPAYGPNGGAEGLRGAVRVDDPADRNGFDFVDAFEDRLGRPDAPRWGLSFRIETKTQGVALTTDNATTRYHLSGKMGYAVRDLATGRQVHTGSASGFTAFSALGPTVSERAAEREATRRLMESLADQVVTQLTATYADWVAGGR